MTPMFMVDERMSSFKWRTRYMYPWIYYMRDERIQFMTGELILSIKTNVVDEIEDRP